MRKTVAFILLAVAAIGCGRGREVVLSRNVIDQSYISTAPKRDMSFAVTFLQFGAEESAAIDRAWSLTTPHSPLTPIATTAPVSPAAPLSPLPPAAPASPVSPVPALPAALWADNGLRIGWASPKDAGAVRAALRRVTTLAAPRREVVMPMGMPFDVKLAEAVPAMNLIYSDGDTTVCRDVSDLEAALRLLPLGLDADARVSLAPFIRSGGASPEAVQLDSLRVEFPLAKGSLLIVGPAAAPTGAAGAAGGRIGSLLYRQADGRSLGTLIIIEPRI